MLAHAIPPRASPLLLLVRQDGAARALFPMLMDGGFGALTTPYTCRYEPLIAPDTIDRAAIFTAFARFCRSFAIARLDALDPATEAEFASGATRAGLAIARFDHFGNWHEDVAGLDWQAWLAGRPGALRETIRRRTRRAERLAGARFVLYRDQNDIASGIAAFEAVYARSWKDPEPFPAFNPAQIRRVLNDEQIVTPGDRHNLVHLAADAGIMDREDRPRARRDGGFDQPLVNI